MKIAVTGTSGFIGSHLMRFLASRGYEVVPIARSQMSGDPVGVPASVDAAVHVAGLTNRRGASADDYMRANRDLADAFARTCERAGIGRLVFLSSAHAQVRSETPYGASKLGGERKIAASGLDYVILRAPAIYGPGAKGAVGSLLRVCRLPLLLPFKTATAKRTMCYVGNLVDAIEFAATTSNIGKQTFEVSDPAPISTAEIVTYFREGLNRRPGLFAAPWLPGLLHGVGRSKMADQIFGEFIITGRHLKEVGWKPRCDAHDALRQTAHYVQFDRSRAHP